jgi:hypothetical protein
MGGRSRNPILIASHVELQTTQSVSHANGTPHRRTRRSRSTTLTDVLFILICARPSRFDSYS